MMEAVRATTYSNSAKMGLAMKRRFWEEDDQIFGGHLYSNLPLGEFSYPSHDYFSRKGVLLGLYANGRSATCSTSPSSARVEHVLTHASKVHPQIRQEFESAYAVWWRKVKYSQGGFASGAPPARRAQFAKVDNRILIGSAAAAPYSEPDWQEGAVAAAWQALTSLHERAMRGLTRSYGRLTRRLRGAARRKPRPPPRVPIIQVSPVAFAAISIAVPPTRLNPSVSHRKISPALIDDPRRPISAGADAHAAAPERRPLVRSAAIDLVVGADDPHVAPGADVARRSGPDDETMAVPLVDLAEPH